MIRKEPYTIPATPEKAAERTIYICDLCHKESPLSDQFKTCVCCKRVVCTWNIVQKGCGGSDPREYGDYPSWYCSICYHLKFEKYDKEFDEIEEIHEADLERLDRKIKAESLATTEWHL